MTTGKPLRYTKVFVAVFAGSLLADQAHATTCEPPAATVVSVQGAVEAKRADAADWQPVAMDDKFCPGDSVRTSAGSRSPAWYGIDQMPPAGGDDIGENLNAWTGTTKSTNSTR